jgi:hypothetical protein
MSFCTIMVNLLLTISVRVNVLVSDRSRRNDKGTIDEEQEGERGARASELAAGPWLGCCRQQRLIDFGSFQRNSLEIPGDLRFDADRLSDI